MLPFNLGIGATAGVSIANSLRFDGSNDYLSRTFGTPTTQNTFTFSAWVKRSKLAALQNLLGVSTNNSIGFPAADTLAVTLAGSATITTTALYRDPSAWLHICYKQTTGAATLYVNGVSVGTSATVSAVFNTAVAHQIGAANTAAYLDGYLSDIYFIDGQALTPSSFGETDSNGVWVPKVYTGTYGNNGFHLDFADGTSTTTLGYDAAGSNDWTLSGMTRAAGVNECWMTDTPTNNYCTLNPLKPVSANGATIMDGALLAYVVAGANAWFQESSSFAMTTGKWYWEVAFIRDSNAGQWNESGIFLANTAFPSQYLYALSAAYTQINSGYKCNNNVITAYGNSIASGGILRIAFDADSGKLYFGDSSGWFSSSDPAGGTNPAFTVPAGSYIPAGTIYRSTATSQSNIYNFGQRAFTYTPPTGFLAPCTANLPAVAIPNPSLHHQVKLDTGANIKGVMDALFSGNVFEWIKDRANVNNHQLASIGRGLTAILQSNTTAAETTYSAPAGSSVGWGWKLGGTPVSNTAGSITSQVSANVTAGISEVLYTGTGATGNVGHGLGVAPKLVIVKQRTVGTVENWAVYNANLANTEYLLLNGTAAKTTGATYWNSTTPTSTVFSIGSAADTNESSKDFVAYCFAEIPGYSKIGSYTGNGSSDGPFVHCGFRPRYVLIKCSSTTGNWELIDTVRDDYNVADAELIANGSAAEAALTMLDITANGFKLRTTDADFNGANTYIYAAFAEHPFGGSNVSPAPAR